MVADVQRIALLDDLQKKTNAIPSTIDVTHEKMKEKLDETLEINSCLFEKMKTDI